MPHRGQKRYREAASANCASGLMPRPVWSQRRKARYGAKTFIQSHQYSGRNAEEMSCEHVGLAPGVICFLFTAHRRFRACLHRGRPNYWPGHGRGLIECHAGRQRVRRTLTLENIRAAPCAPSRAKEIPRSGKRELRVGPDGPPRLEPAPKGAVRREDIYTKPSVIRVQRRRAFL